MMREIKYFTENIASRLKAIMEKFEEKRIVLGSNGETMNVVFFYDPDVKFMFDLIEELSGDKINLVR